MVNSVQEVGDFPYCVLLKTDKSNNSYLYVVIRVRALIKYSFILIHDGIISAAKKGKLYGKENVSYQQKNSANILSL